MTWKDFFAKAKAVVLKVYHWAYAEIDVLLSLFKSPGKDKYSSKRVIALALVVNGIWMLRLAKSPFDAIVGGGQVLGGIVLMVIAALTKS